MLVSYKFISQLTGVRINITRTLYTINFIFYMQLYLKKNKLMPTINCFKLQYLMTTLFCKKKNFNKLYLNNSYIFVTSGIILKYNNLFKKNLKNKPTIWNLFFLILTKITNFTYHFFIKNFFFNLKKIFKNLLKYNLLNSWIYLNLFTLTYNYNNQRVRRIKKWIKKKYFKVIV